MIADSPLPPGEGQGEGDLRAVVPHKSPLPPGEGQGEGDWRAVGLRACGHPCSLLATTASEIQANCFVIYSFINAIARIRHVAYGMVAERQKMPDGLCGGALTLTADAHGLTPFVQPDSRLVGRTAAKSA